MASGHRRVKRWQPKKTMTKKSVRRCSNCGGVVSIDTSQTYGGLCKKCYRSLPYINQSRAQ